MFDGLKKVSDWILELVYPYQCPFCLGIVEGSPKLCKKCGGDLPFLKKGEKNWRLKGEVECFAVLRYTGYVVDAVKRYKFRYAFYNASCFGEMMAEVMAEAMRCGREYDVITWVPLSEERFAWRGFNQAELLGEVVSQELGVQCASLLEKWKENDPQSGIEDALEREKNTEGVYRMLGEVLTVRGLRILLVDDVITTGSTVSSCVKVLYEAGAVSVDCLALARSR